MTTVAHVLLVKFVTTNGAALKETLTGRLNLRFVSLSRCVRYHCHYAMSRLFTRHNRRTFHRVRHGVLRRITRFRSMIVSANKNAPYFFSGVRCVGRRNAAIFLRTSISILRAHLAVTHARHPLITKGDRRRLHTCVGRVLSHHLPCCDQTARVFYTSRLRSVHRMNRSIRQFGGRVLLT